MDWIEEFMSYTEELPSPDNFRLWTGISTIAGACERRIWMKSSLKRLYPNLYILLIGNPSVGKSASLVFAEEFWRSTKKVFIAPNAVSKASLLDVLARSGKKIIINNGDGLLEYNALAIAASEFGVLVPSHDPEFLSVLVDIYDNKDNFSDEKRTTKSVDIICPMLNIIAGTTPGYMMGLLPEEAWNSGFMSRQIMIYASEGPKVDFFDAPSRSETSKQKLIQGLIKITERMGEIQWSADAKAGFRGWIAKDQAPVPEHSKLRHYCGRRNIHIAKLAMISCISRGEDLEVLAQDLTRAMDWLFAAEIRMPDIFREMVLKSDAQVIQELHRYLFQLWSKDKKPVHESRLIHFLQQRVPSGNILRIMEIAEKSNIINKNAGGPYYTPRPTHEHGIE